LTAAPRRALACAVLLTSTALLLPIRLPAREGADKKGEPAPADKKSAPLFPPAGDILGVYDKLSDALRRAPDAVVLTFKKYEEMRAELARLRALLERPETIPPSKCLLKGKVEGNLVQIQAQFEFVTDRPRVVVSLACGQAHALGVALDGRTPQLLGGGRLPGGEPEGFSVQVEKPGEHQLTLDLALPLEARPGGPGLTLDLPRAASTRLEIDLPGGTRDVRLGGKGLAETLVSLRGTRLAGSLGAADRLELSWKGAHPGSGAPVLLADGLVSVRFDSRGLSSEARLVLRALGGPVGQWRLLVPSRADVKPVAADEARVSRIDTLDQKGASVRTIRLKEASTDPLTLTVRLTTPVPRPGTRAGVGPFTVLGASRQSGSVLVSNAAPELHLEFHPAAGLSQRAASDEEQRRDPALVAAFHYGPPAGSSASDRPAPGAPGSLPWLDLEAQTVRGQIRARVTHTLTLAPDANSPAGTRPGALRWQVTTEVVATPRWADVDRLLVKMPPGCDYSEDGVPLPDKVRQVVYDRAARTVEFRLVRGGEALKPFTLTLEATYAPPEEGPTAAGGVRPGRAVLLPLPHLAGAVVLGGEVTVRVPRELELVPPEGGNAGLELARQTAHELSWRCPRRAPERVEVGWRAWRPEVRAEAVVDLTLAGRQGRVRHELRFRFAPPAPAQVALRVPAALGDSLRVVQGGRLAAPAVTKPGGPPGPGETLRTIALEATGQEGAALVVLDYAFGVPERPGAAGFAVPLVVPEGVTQGETRVRVWAEPEALPRPAGPLGAGSAANPWVELGIEEVPGQPRLPALVLRGGRIDLPLALRLDEPGSSFAVLVERALVRVTVGGPGAADGLQHYRTSYLVARLAGRHLDVELPAPVHTLQLRVLLDGRPVAYETVDEQGERDHGGRVARLRLSPNLVKRRAVLDLTYQLAPGRGGGPLRTTLRPPVLRGEPGRVPTRWQVNLPANWVPVAVAGGEGPGPAHTWGWRGWLLAPRLALTGADLERWFAGGEAAVETPAAPPSLVCWRDGAEPVVITHVAQQTWLLVCSLGLLVLGLGLSWLTWPAPGRSGPGAWLWPLLALLTLGVVLVALRWPTALAWVAYGCQPGAVVLALVAAVQWLLHERYRRQIVFLPSFSRGRGSSLLREAPRPPSEPSTVDVPARAASSSSVERGG
jgi:hypothetical protein